jgi:hypothetical protein
MRLKKTTTATTQVPPRTPPSPNLKTVEEIEEDELWGDVVTRFPFSSLPDLPIHHGGGPGLYVLDQNSRGLIPRPLLQNPKTATATLEDLFRDTTEGSTLLQLKAEEAFVTIIARKMVDN